MSTREHARYKREAQHNYNLTHGHASFRSCARCGTLAYCAGKTYENQRCRTCAVERGAR